MDSSIRYLDLLVLSFVLGELSFGLGDVAAATTATVAMVAVGFHRQR